MFPNISTVILFKLASGDDLYLQAYKFIGKKAGKKAYIQSNLHGSEIVGNGVINQLIEFFLTVDSSEIEGEIWLVPACNPLGTNQRHHFFSTGRYNSYDGKDWNRIFWDYEKECDDLEEFAKSQLDLEYEEIKKNYFNKLQYAFEQQIKKMQSPPSLRLSDQYRLHLQSLCLDADYIIDIHSSSNYGIDYLYCFYGREESARYFGLDYGILMTEYDGDAFDEAFMKPWLALEKQFAQLGKAMKFDLESYTLELGTGMQMASDSVAKGVAGIKNYLTYKGILKLPDYPLPPTQTRLVTRDKIEYYYAPTGGMIQNRLPLKSQVKAGDRLYQLLSFNKSGELPNVLDICAETDGFIFDLSINHGINQGEYVMGIMNY